MNITVIYASGRKTRSSTYQIAQMLIKELLEDGTCFSFFLPDDMPHICNRMPRLHPWKRAGLRRCCRHGAHP